MSISREVFGKDTSLAGITRITAIPHIAQYLLMPCVKEFTQLYPEVYIHIDSSYQVSNLSRHDADVAIRMQNQSDGHLIGRRIPDIVSAAYATPDYIEEHRFTGKPLTAQWISWIANSKKMEKWHNETPFQNCKIKHCIYDSAAHLQTVKYGLGCSILFCLLETRKRI